MYNFSKTKMSKNQPKIKSLSKITLIFGAFLGLAAPLQAHHSYVMFDRTKVLKITGEVTKWQWTNPHIYLRMKDPKSGKKELVFEGHSPSIYRKAGIGRNITAAGEKVTLTYHPMADGSPGGMMVSINGKTAD